MSVVGCVCVGLCACSSSGVSGSLHCMVIWWICTGPPLRRPCTSRETSYGRQGRCRVSGWLLTVTLDIDMLMRFVSSETAQDHHRARDTLYQRRRRLGSSGQECARRRRVECTQVRRRPCRERPKRVAVLNSQSNYTHVHLSHPYYTHTLFSASCIISPLVFCPLDVSYCTFLWVPGRRCSLTPSGILLYPVVVSSLSVDLFACLAHSSPSNLLIADRRIH